MGGDVDIAAVGGVLADPARCRMLSALMDGRALPASVLADEAGVARSTASGHLRRLVDANFVVVEAHGRHRYHRLAGPEVAALFEAASQLAPIEPVRSLRDGTRLHLLRQARTCYQHLAGRLGVAVLGALIERGEVTGHDGSFRPDAEHLSATVAEPLYALTDRGITTLSDLGADPDVLTRHRGGLRHCVDWSEQRHHLSGPVGATITRALGEAGWFERGRVPRSLLLTERGRAGLRSLGVNDPDLLEA